VVVPPSTWTSCHCWLVPFESPRWSTAAPSAVEAPCTSTVLPLLRFSSTYQALVSTVAATAVVVVTAATPPSRINAVAAMMPGRRMRRHA
jgi:hypothetical protein